MEDAIREIFESGRYKLAYKLMLGECIDHIDIDIKHLLKYTNTSKNPPRFCLSESWYSSGIIPNRTHDFTLEIVSPVNDPIVYSVYLLDFRGNPLRAESIKEYADLLAYNSKIFSSNLVSGHLTSVSKEDVLNLLFREAIFDEY